MFVNRRADSIRLKQVWNTTVGTDGAPDELSARYAVGPFTTHHPALCARAPFGRNALRQVHLEERLVRDITLIRQHLELVKEPLREA